MADQGKDDDKAAGGGARGGGVPEAHGEAGAGLRLATFTAGLRWQDVPAVLRAKVLDHVVDTVGVMYCGIDMPSCQAARRAAHRWGAGDAATVIGTGERAAAPSAAFINALHGRIHTYDDTYEPGTVHPGSPVIAAALALCEERGSDGVRLLSAVLAGYEVAARVARAVSPSHYAAGFHNTGTCNAFGAAAAAARVLELDGLSTAQAFGLAGATAAGLRQHQIDGSMLDSAFHGARAAQSGVMVAQMRAQGVLGPPAILEGPLGFCAVMAPQRDTAALDAELGERYEFAQLTIKPFPTCRFAHGPTDAALTLRRRHAIDPDAIDSVEIATFRQSIDVSDRPRLNNAFDATVSHQYSVALALVLGAVGLDSIRRPQDVDPRVHALHARTRVVHDPALEQQFPACWPHRVTVTMRDGTRYATLSEFPPGRVSPVASSVVDAKFIENSEPYLGAAGAARALQALRDLPQCGDVASVTRLLAVR
jgi:2-methylcitrate dehydratase PrpD